MQIDLNTQILILKSDLKIKAYNTEQKAVS